MSTFEVRELSVRSGDAVLRRAGLAVGAGEAVAVLGDGGASALVRTVAGVLAPAAGAVRLGGDDATGRSAADLARAGVVLVPAGWAAFGALTTFENVLVGARGDVAVASDVLGRLGLDGRPQAGTLDDARRRVLAVGVALARRPRLLLVDGLHPAGLAATRVVLSAARGSGTSVVLAERAPFAGRDVVVPEHVDPAAFDRVLVARNGVLRPWRPPED